MITISSTIYSDSKLMYFPTETKETYRLLGLLGRINIDYIKKSYLKEYIYNKEQWQEFQCKSLDYNIPMDLALYDYWLFSNQYDMIREYCTYEIGFKNDNNIIISDYFAGEGLWLDCFKSFIPLSDNCNKFLLIANELEENRFKVIKDNSNIDDCFNSSFEELNLPKNSCSLCLFNPPYGSTNNVRNVKYYINLILNRKLLYNPTNTKDYKTGYMVFVIRKDDFLDSLDVICKNFDVLRNSIYKVNPKEYAKFKQYIFIAKLKRFPYDLNNITDAIDFQKQYNEIKNIIESEPEFQLSMYNTYQMMNYPYIDYQIAKENHQYIQVSQNYMSKNDNVWKWIKDITELKNLGEEKLTVPKPLKLGEIANILASGMINGEIELDSKGRHVVIGGTKKIEKKEVNTYKDDNGEKVTETKIIKMSLPYLNILCSENGELKIKELGEAE